MCGYVTIGLIGVKQEAGQRARKKAKGLLRTLSRHTLHADCFLRNTMTFTTMKV